MDAAPQLVITVLTLHSGLQVFYNLSRPQSLSLIYAITNATNLSLY